MVNPQTVHLHANFAHLLLAWGALVVVHACERATSGAQPAECAIDDDCTLLPRITCCGECDFVLPFEAVPRTSVDAMLIEAETDCAPHERSCVPPVCDEVPPGCDPHVLCIDGSCRLDAQGCDLPSS